ncbi:calcium/sodium antiporter [Propionibacteriaceae bacterium Y1923]
MGPALLIIVGLLALVVGAELLVRGGSGLATRLGIPPIIVGLTVVAIGTSFPELAVGIQAAVAGSGGLAVGNIVGTNIVNLLLILGVSAVLSPIAVESRTIRLDLPSMAAATALFVVVAWDGRLTRLEGIILLVAGVIYTWVILRSARSEPQEVQEEYEHEYEVPNGKNWKGILADSAMLVIGLVIIVVGSDWLVDGAVAVAVSRGVSEAVIGLTIVAIGTSAPELVTTVVSTIKGERDIAIGNLLGSSVYNLLFILGATMALSPETIGIPRDVLTIDLVVLAVAVAACIPVFRSGQRIERFEGIILVIAYLAHLAYLLTARV